MSIERIRAALDAGPTPGPWSVETVSTSCGVCHKVGPFPGKRPDDPPRHACLYADYPSAGNPADDELEANAAYIAACNPSAIRALLADRDEREAALRAEVEALRRTATDRAGIIDSVREWTRGVVADNVALRAERDALRDILLRKGFVPCDIPACNCGSWHHRYGLPERMQEIKDALAEAGHELSNANGNLTLNALKELITERDALKAENERLLALERDVLSTLPGVYYMDPPDGGDVSLLKQLQRMSNDAARYRLLRRKFAIISDGEGNAEFCPINLPRPTYIAPNTAIELDTALDRERLGLDGAKRPPTPVGWSDTDWIKHLQEQDEQPHPLAGQHINQGSMDAAADAYEAEYNAARGKE